jgi:hypothetical protein
MRISHFASAPARPPRSPTYPMTVENANSAGAGVDSKSTPAASWSRSSTVREGGVKATPSLATRTVYCRAASPPKV